MMFQSRLMLNLEPAILEDVSLLFGLES